MTDKEKAYRGDGLIGPQDALCPKCGTPARIVLIERAAIRCQIKENGSPGEVLSLRGVSRVVGYECGGGHGWKVG